MTWHKMSPDKRPEKSGVLLCYGPCGFSFCNYENSYSDGLLATNGMLYEWKHNPFEAWLDEDDLLDDMVKSIGIPE